MDNAGLLNRMIKEQKNKTKIQETERAEFVKFLIFQINEKKYAVYANEIREIAIDLSLYYLPFVPVYITGFINRHGEPYTVFDLNMLFDQKKLNSSTFLILSREDDQIAFLISDVVEILTVNKRDVHLITTQDITDDFFSGSITSADISEIFILNTASIIRRLENDVETK